MPERSVVELMPGKLLGRGQLSDPPGLLLIMADRWAIQATVRTMKTLESKNHNLRSEVHVGKS